jgi:hypothetical protein
MRELVAEILLRLSKVLAATIVGAILYIILVGPLGAAASVELALIAWLAGAAFILLVETSPI